MKSKQKVYRIETKDLKKNDPLITPAFQGKRICDYHLGTIKSVQVRKRDNGDVYVDISYLEVS